MPTVSKTSSAVLAATAVGIGLARVLQVERYHRRKLALHAAEMHQAWLSDVASEPALRAAWATQGESLSSDDYALLVQCNRQVSLLSAKFRAGLLNRHTLRIQARWLMKREIGRTYWREFGAFREQEAQDRVDRVFNRILADEYVAFSDPDAVAA
ncbi:DUF6082 family protein [Streptomyces sp. NPDC006335]|uniref:DUF6082 family protein n=1 Tax=Streptomyces sp. NPDC006335 TaxID=3156895 RepID=UPI0033AA1E13